MIPLIVNFYHDPYFHGNIKTSCNYLFVYQGDGELKGGKIFGERRIKNPY